MSLTKRHAVPDDEVMKDRWLQIRVDEAIKAALLELRRAEPDLPGDSEMVRRLIERAKEALPKSRK